MKKQEDKLFNWLALKNAWTSSCFHSFIMQLMNYNQRTLNKSMGRWIFPPKQFWIPNPKKNIRTKKQNQYTKGHIPVLLKKKKTH